MMRMSKNRSKAALIASGFADGFFSAGGLFTSTKKLKARDYRTSVSDAWDQVGRTMEGVMTKEGVVIEQKTNARAGRTKAAA
jgi:hypothetical protein